MRLLGTLKNAALLVAILSLNSVSLASHVSAMPAMSHEMGGMNHSASDSTSCATQCRTAVFNQEEGIDSRQDEKDNEPANPFYNRIQGWQAHHTATKERLYAAVVKPPPKIPIYILYGVFRV